MKDITDIRDSNIDKCVSSFNGAYQKTLIIMSFLFVLTDKNITDETKNQIGIPFVGVNLPDIL